MKRTILILVLGLLTMVSLYYTYIIFDARSSTLNKVSAAKAQVKMPLSKSDLSNAQQEELLAVQDPRFYSHKGTDFLGKRVTTITQSLVKFLYFEKFNPGIAKIKQSLIARFALDPLVSKDEQLELFLNLTYFGSVDDVEVRGFGQAAKVYFSKQFKDLSDEEYFKLLAMLSGPNLYNVKMNPTKNTERVTLFRKQLGSHNQNSSKLIPFDLLDNRMFVDVMINGQGPFRFVFDTGGSNCLTPEVAKRLELQMKPIENATGAGEKSVKAWKAQVSTFQIGDIKLSSQEFMVLDFSPIKKAFALPAFDGIFGYEFLKKFSAKIDFVENKISFLPMGLLPTEGYSAVPFSLVGDKPVISAKINESEAKVLIDTGDRSALTIFSNFIKKKTIQHVFKGHHPQITGYGIGGPIPAMLSKVDSLEISPQAKLKNVVSRSPVTKGGFNAIPNVNASIGNEILRQFDVIFDYQNKLVYFRPNKFYGESTQFVPVPVL